MKKGIAGVCVKMSDFLSNFWQSNHVTSDDQPWDGTGLIARRLLTWGSTGPEEAVFISLAILQDGGGIKVLDPKGTMNKHGCRTLHSFNMH